MNENPTIITERVDDIPLLLEHLHHMGLPALLDHHFPTHGNWQGLSLGWVSTIWLSSILSRGDHRMVHVEPWALARLSTLKAVTGQEVRRVDFTDDRLETVLRRLRNDERWTAFEAGLNNQTIRVYDLSAEQVYVDSTSASTYAAVSEGGLFQFGHSKDHRPDLAQVKVMQAVVDPLGMPLATDVVSGERADDPLYLPCILRVQASLGRRGLLYVGDGKMAARQTRATLDAAGDFYLCPLAGVHHFEGELATALEPVQRGEQALTAVMRDNAKGESELIAEGYEYPVSMSHCLGETDYTWHERCLVVRSLRHARAAEEGLRSRVAKATEQTLALNQRGQGKRRFETMAAMRRAVEAILKRHDVADLIRFRLQPQVTERSVRAYRGRPARVETVRDTRVEVEVDDAALEAATEQLGWRLYATNQGSEQLSLEQAVLAYREQYQVERGFGRLKGRPLSLTPMFVQRGDHATGLIRLLSIALRALTLLEFVVRRELKAEGSELAGLYAGNAKRQTARPTAERLLEAFQEITVTIIRTPDQTIGHVTSLNLAQQRILELLGFSAELYTALADISLKPP